MQYKSVRKEKPWHIIKWPRDMKKLVRTRGEKVNKHEEIRAGENKNQVMKKKKNRKDRALLKKN